MARGSTYFVGSSTPVWQARIIPRVERVQPPKEHGRRRAWQWLGGERASLPPALPRPDARPEKTVIDPGHTRQLGRIVRAMSRRRLFPILCRLTRW